ncbi:MAG: ABC transporter permease [Thermoplasmata archaeon]|nr:ABC transporter permease [Thermoplasmata archaeon]
MIGDIYAVYLREMIRMYRSKARMITTIVMPFLWLIVIGNAFKNAFASSMSNIDFLSFLTPGILVMTIVFTSTISGITTVFDREFGFLKEILVSPISRGSILIGKMLGGVTQAMMQAAIILLLAIAMGVSFDINGIAGMILTMFLVAVSFVSLGLAFASRFTNMEGFQMVMNFLIQPMIFLSGAFYPTRMLPSWLQWAVKLNPLTYGVECNEIFFHRNK